jgi:hypothetical protein
VVAVFTLALRRHYLRQLFPNFSLTRQISRAFGPTALAVAGVLAVRAIEPLHRSAVMAVAELLIYLVITVLATWLTERTLLKEAISYLRRARGGLVPLTT